jgi:hypothetical protein
MRVHDVDALPTNRAAERDGRSRIELRGRSDSDNRNAERRRALGQRLAGSRGDEHPVPQARQHLGVPEELSLAAAPSAFGIELEYR